MPTTPSQLLLLHATYHIAGTLWIETDGERCFGPGKMELLQGIEKTGSINKAAKAMGMSYKKAWKMVQELNAHFAQPMVITQGGGEGGGGSSVTPEAKILMTYHAGMRARLEAFLEQERKLLAL